ncbi:MAG: hypothetical protein WKF35_05375 [Ferruginibacter sp.]
MNIFEFPSNLGIKKRKDETEPGVRFLPAGLKTYAFYASPLIRWGCYIRIYSSTCKYKNTSTKTR